MQPDQHDVQHQTNDIQSSFGNYQTVTSQFGNFNSHEHHIAVEIIIKIIKRNYSRHFIKRLMFAYIENLRKSQTVVIQPRREVQQVNWPFRELYVKKYRTEEENQLFEFVNLCAEMIQSKFKAYITRKRHLLAYKKAAKTKDVLQSFVKRWKIYRTYNCNKIVEIRAKIRQIQRELDIQQQNFTNRDAKKIKGLYKYLQIHNKMFHQTFKLLMDTGMWTLQKNMKPVIVKKKLSPPRQTRARQFRPQKRQARRARVEKQQHQEQHISDNFQNEVKKQNIDQNISNQFLKSYPTKSQWSTSTEDRPIKAAGQYKISDQELSKSYVEPKVKKNTVEDENQKGQIENQPKAKQRIKKAQQLQKRTKYDPRKAIQEQKNRKNQEIQKNKSQVKINEPIAKQTIEKEQKKLQQDKEKKVLDKSEKSMIKQSQSNTQQKQKQKKLIKQKKPQQKAKPVVELQNSNSKQLKVMKKVSSKVDCWVNKKQPEPEWVKTYKTRLLQNKQQSEEKTLQNLRKSVQRNVSVKKQDRVRVLLNRSDVEEKQQKIEPKRNRFQKSQQQEKDHVNQSWKQKQREIESLKQKQDEFAGKRKNSTHNLQQQIKAILQKKNNMNQMKKKQAHRPIQELQQTYNKHYGDRYQNLMPKLSFLAVARNQQRRSRIPILLDQDQKFDNWFDSLYHSTHYWKMISQQDRIYKSFLAS